MDKAKQEIHNQASIFGQVGTNEGTIIQNFSQNLGINKPLMPEQIWTVPHPRNPFFTGREYYLDQLHNNLLAQKATALTQPQAINGLGGIGKTQIAVEYAHRHRETYPYVFWVNAANRETLLTNFITLAKLLGLSIFNETDQEIIITFVRNWLGTHERWLLIMDNADNLELACSFLPTGNTGHIILTTREQAVSSFANIEVKKMDQTESTLLLLRRAKILDTTTPEDRKNAEAIARELDGLPLALDQAGAHIEETRCTTTDYLVTYKCRQDKFLHHRGRNSSYHPDPVATTWSLSFEQIEHHNPLAADLLLCCAFLAPNEIPEEFFTKGAKELSLLLHPIANDSSLLNEAIGELTRFSLVSRNRDNHTFFIHRLVQAVLRTRLNKTKQRIWIKRIVRMINHVFPEKIDVTSWKDCQRYVTHAQSCATFIEAYHLAFSEASTLLNKTAYYLSIFALYTEAESLFQLALQIDKQILGPEHPDTATVLNNLAFIHKSQGKYEQAEPLYQHALSINEHVFGPEHISTSHTLNNLALLYKIQSKYEQAEPLYQRALRIHERILGPEHPRTALSLNNLATLYDSQGKYEQAEPLLQRALHINEQVLGLEHPNTAQILNNLAALYAVQGKYEQAEPLYQRALYINERILGLEHPNTAQTLNNLAVLYDKQGKYEQAKPLYQLAVHIYTITLGPEHPITKSVYTNYAQGHESAKRKKK